MFEKYSERARRIVFLSRKTAGRRGAAEIGVEDLMDALAAEDQGDYVKASWGRTRPGPPVRGMPKHEPFLTAEAAEMIRRGLEPLLLPNDAPLPDSADMPLSAASRKLLEAAKKLSEELSHKPETPTHLHAGHIEPLHLLAAVLADETSEVARIVRQAGVERDAVMAAIRSGGYPT